MKLMVLFVVKYITKGVTECLIKW